MGTVNIKKLRKAIDELDEKIVSTLNKRTKLAIKIGEIKDRFKKSVYSPEREQHIYNKLKKLNNGPLNNKTLSAVYREIMSGTIMLQRPIKVAYLGPEATFTHLASQKKFGAQVEYISMQSITDVFNEVERGSSDFGVVPVENSIEGAISHTLDMFVDSDLKICSEISLAIEHNLLAKCKISDIKKVYSKSQVFGQCRLWLECNLPGRPLMETTSTTKAAEIAAKEKNSAAIASSLAAQIYKVKIKAKSIEDFPHNVTRFLVIGKKEAGYTGRDKTSVLFSIKDRMGALHDMLTTFKNAKINLTKIESRPSKKKAWDYYFFVDMQGHIKEPRLRKALTNLEKKCHFLKIVGSYPQSA
ncbi:MAG: prephenate dehydratase [Candidatus Omnitrophica bacterium]|nr:prephenate dehydratase [Candidatus Omnitrophota bacterium]